MLYSLTLIAEEDRYISMSSDEALKLKLLKRIITVQPLQFN